MDREKILDLAVKGVIGSHSGLVVRIRPATQFERATWAGCPDDGLRVLIDEDGTKTDNLNLSTELPEAAFVSAKV